MHFLFPFICYLEQDSPEAMAYCSELTIPQSFYSTPAQICDPNIHKEMSHKLIHQVILEGNWTAHYKNSIIKENTKPKDVSELQETKGT